MVQRVEKSKKDEVEAKAQAACDGVKLAEQQKTGGEEHEGQKPPLSEAETKELMEQGGVDPQMLSTEL